MSPRSLRSQRDEILQQLSARDYLLPSEAAFVFNRDKATVNRWIARGLTTHLGADGQRYVRRDQVGAWIRDPANGVRPPRQSKLLPNAPA